MTRYRHKKRGSSYEFVGAATLQTARPIQDGQRMIVYKSETDGTLWVRPDYEFYDGRFEVLPHDDA